MSHFGIIVFINNQPHIHYLQEKKIFSKAQSLQWHPSSEVKFIASLEVMTYAIMILNYLK